MDRRTLLDLLEEAIGDRKLIWVGSRGHDAHALLGINQFHGVYSVAAPLGALSVKSELCLEELSQRRPDLDTYTIDEDTSEEAHFLRTKLLESLQTPTVMAAYRPWALLSTAYFPRSHYVSYLGMFHERQTAFEHKPWVETQLRARGVNTVPWKYFTAEDCGPLEEELEAHGALLLRANRSDGGVGLGIVREPEALRARMGEQLDGFLGVTKLLEPHIPLNVNACVFPDGNITVHGPSLQLIGIPGLTNRTYGYCGNDFAAIRGLEDRWLSQFEAIVQSAGEWLFSQGYRGAFGVDALVHDDRVYLVEINPRFQGSSMPSSRLDRQCDRPDLYLCHLAAMLGLEAPRLAPLSDLARQQPELAHMIYHNLKAVPAQIGELPHSPSADHYELVPDGPIAVDPHAILCRVVATRQVTEDGRSIGSENLV